MYDHFPQRHLQLQGFAMNPVVLVIALTVLLPSTAVANNSPRSDGALSLMLVVPVALIGGHFARARLDPKRRPLRALAAIGVTIVAILYGAGTIVGVVAMLVVMVYGVIRGIQVVRIGGGGRSC